jgi:hypothetical protein
MTAAAFRAALARLGLSHYQTAAFLGKNTRLIRDWASGRKLIPKPIAARLIWRVVLVRGPLFKMIIPAGAGATYFSIIAWNRAVGGTEQGQCHGDAP